MRETHSHYQVNPEQEGQVGQGEGQEAAAGARGGDVGVLAEGDEAGHGGNDYSIMSMPRGEAGLSEPVPESDEWETASSCISYFSGPLV